MDVLVVTYSHEMTVSAGELTRAWTGGAICIPVRARSRWSRHGLQWEISRDLLY